MKKLLLIVVIFTSTAVAQAPWRIACHVHDTWFYHKGRQWQQTGCVELYSHPLLGGGEHKGYLPCK